MEAFEEEFEEEVREIEESAMEEEHDVKARFVGRVVGFDEEGAVEVRHIYHGPHEHEGRPCTDPGAVSIFMVEDNSEDGPAVGLIIDVSEALVLASHLQRTAALVLETFSERPDIEREASRWSAL